MSRVDSDMPLEEEGVCWWEKMGSNDRGEGDSVWKTTGGMGGGCWAPLLEISSARKLVGVTVSQAACRVLWGGMPCVAVEVVLAKCTRKSGVCRRTCVLIRPPAD
jgi:hypothetical protein